MSTGRDDHRLWQAKIHARLHDPAEKALVLLRDPAGHEGGSVRALHERLFVDGVPEAIRHAVKRADWWASAADRPQFPKTEKDGPYARWTQVRFDRQPVLIHPLTGRRLTLASLQDTDVARLKSQSQAHFERIVDAVGDADPQRLALALWRFGAAPPESARDESRLGELWRFLPADTRVPDHSIWDHLDLTSAFAGAFAADDQSECALLTVSLGPVQDFIAEARTASDLWAGSHLLSTMTWQAMRVIAEILGPDSILFPRLRGVACVDLWLQQEMGLPAHLFADEPWRQGTATDANPLFAAALPNRFLAVVPAETAAQLGEQITERVRAWANARAHAAFSELLAEIGEPEATSLHARGQIDAQLAGFPEVHWSVAPYSSAIPVADVKRQTVADTQTLARTMAPFFDEKSADMPGFLASPAWAVLRRAVDIEGARFYEPNPGVLYPAVQELAERSLAATKSVRGFAPLTQVGYRCSLTATTEWLTDAPEQLYWSREQRQQRGTLWTRLANARPAWARKGEHLGALALLKRAWPSLYVEEIADAIGQKPHRFVVSTHAMSLAHSLARLADQPLNIDDGLRHEIQACERSALPWRLITRTLNQHPDGDLIARIPAWLDAAEAPETLERRRGRLERLLGSKPEAYYGLVLMDGDEMGSWLAGDSDKAGTYETSFHPAIRQALADRFADNTPLRDYLQSRRALSPSRHYAISGALGDFASVIARHVVEDEHMGRLLYAGGDDLMAMVTVSDMLSMMATLRGAYSGTPLDESTHDSGVAKRFDNGFYRQRGQLHLTMGDKATASMGAVVAHHQAPLGQVQRALKAAEHRAKQAGRNAFCIQIIKRGGGAVTLTLPWASPEREAHEPSHLRCLEELTGALGAGSGASRRAAYNVETWIRDLPEAASFASLADYRAFVAALLHQQFERQGLEKRDQPIHATRLAALCDGHSAAADAERVANMLAVAEFFARECRSPE